MRYGLVVCLMLVSVVAYAGKRSALTPEQHNYITALPNIPTEFEVPKQEADDAWARAQTFIAEHSPLRIQTASDYIVETYKPMDLKALYGYRVARTPAGDAYQFKVTCVGLTRSVASNARMNAHILANYIKTGNLPYPELINK